VQKARARHKINAGPLAVQVVAYLHNKANAQERDDHPISSKMYIQGYILHEEYVCENVIENRSDAR
jgi:hypothetical protein